MSRWLLLPLTAPLALAQGGPGVEGNWMGTLNAGALKTACGAEGRQSGRWVAFREIRQPRPGRQGSAGIDGPAKRLKVALELKMLAAAYDPYPYVEDEVVYENKAGAAKLAGTLTQPPGEARSRRSC